MVVVYFRRMKTSTSAYMFALGIADTSICLNCILVITMHVGEIKQLIVIYVFNTSVMFSTCLLAFLATERCMAVARPRKFSLSTRKAKMVLVIFGATAMCCAAIASATRYFGFNRTYVILITSLANVCLLVLITSYSVVAVILLKRMKAARRQVDVVAMTRSSADAVAATELNVLSTRIRTFNNGVAPSTAKVMNSVNAQRSTLVLFVVIAVFVLCWLPFFLRQYGLVVYIELKRLFTINSVVNPFIYSFLSPMFRNDVRQFYREARARLTSFC